MVLAAPSMICVDLSDSSSGNRCLPLVGNALLDPTYGGRATGKRIR
jgi:hypothetical protein